MLSQTTGLEKRIISVGWFLILSFLGGLVYIFLLPPWQQNDEPGQFEYVWLAANLDHWPDKGQFDWTNRREILASSVEFEFFTNRGILPNLITTTQPPDIGVAQLGSPPLYYFWASLPLRLLKGVDITTQFYLARMMSLLLFLSTVYYSYQISVILFGNHPLAMMLASFITLFPQLVYRMTAVNDDSVAVASTTFLIWMSVRGIKYGADWKTWLGIPLGMALCYLSKTTAWFALSFGVVALLLGIFERHQKWVWAGLFLASFGAVFLVFDFGKTVPAYFYQKNRDVQHLISSSAADGKYVFVTNRQDRGFYQVIDRTKLSLLGDDDTHKITVGVWVWANKKDVKVPFVHLEFDGVDYFQIDKVAVSDTPIFLAASATVPKNFRTGLLRVDVGQINDDITIYWDCFIMLPGEHKSFELPETERNCRWVNWAGFQAENLVRNPSGEKTWRPFRHPVQSLLSKTYSLRSSDLLAMFDPPTSYPYFRDAAVYLYRTFWGRFNWGTLPLAGNKPYRVFILPTGLALVGNALALLRFRRRMSWSVVLFLFLLMMTGLWYTLIRFVGDWHMYYLLLPQSRYFFPSIVAVGFFLCIGWYTMLKELFSFTNKTIRKNYLVIGFIIILLIYNLWAWYTIWSFWYP